MPPDTPRGRGTGLRPDSRFIQWQRAPLDEGWPSAEASPTVRTELTVDTARSIITRNRSPDVPFEQSINPYRVVPPFF